MSFTQADLPEILRNLPNGAGAANGSQHSPSVPTGVMLDVLGSGGEGFKADSEFIDAVNVDEALEIYSAVRAVGAEHSAEIGFCCGGSGLAILKALEDQGRGTHHACDPYQSSYAKNAGRRNVDRAKLAHRLDFHEQFPEEVFPGLPQLQFVFIDASHLFDISILDFVLADKRIEVGGVVAFHDLWMPSLQKLVRYILTNRNYEIFRPIDRPAVRPASLRSKLKEAAGSALKRVPRANSIFAPELLEPWSAYGFGNMAFLRKTATDNRDWRHHQPF